MGSTDATAAEAPVDGIDAGFPVLLLSIGADTYALPLEVVREVVPGPRVTNLPTAPPVLRGVINLRGEIVPLFDTGALLGFAPGMSLPYAVLVETAHGLAALAATSMPETARLHEPVGRSDIDGSTETYLVGDRRLAVGLDLAALLSPARIAP